MAFELIPVIRGFHVYKQCWGPKIGEKVQCVIEENNKYDKHAVALMKDETIVGHVPAKHSKIFKCFIR